MIRLRDITFWIIKQFLGKLKLKKVYFKIRKVSFYEQLRFLFSNPNDKILHLTDENEFLKRSLQVKRTKTLKQVGSVTTYTPRLSMLTLNSGAVYSV